MCPFDDDNDLTSLKPKAISLWHAHQSVLSERDALAQKVKDLEAQVAKKNRALFGPKSERSKPSESAASGTPAAIETPTAGDVATESSEPNKRGRGNTRRPQPRLRQEQVVHELPADELTCEECGGTFALFEGQNEESTEIDVIRREFVQRKHVRQKYLCRCGACPRTAKGPLKLKEGNLYSVAFGAHVAAAKYDQHQPLERQARVMQSEGLNIDSQTLWDQTDSVAFWSIGAYRKITAQVLSAPVVGADETQWRLMDTRSNAKEPTSRWWVWAVRSPAAVVYHLDEHRSKDAAATLLRGYEGVVMCDGYGAYLSLAAQFASIKLAHCWSHIRREFHAIEASTAGASGGMLALIDELFAIDREARTLGEALLAQAQRDEDRALAEAGASTLLLHARSTRAAPLLDRIASRALELGLSQPRENALYTACAKMARQWEGLVRFVGDARIPLHNNDTEQSQRAPVLGRKNHQGSRSERGTRVSAILYTLVESAKLAKVDPERYLLLCVRRALRKKPPVTPSEVTAAMLVEDCELSEDQASAALGG